MAIHMTYGDVARELSTTLARAKGQLEGLEPAIKAGNGRIMLFDDAEVKQHLFEKNKDLLTFLGYLSPEQSYDALVIKES